MSDTIKGIYPLGFPWETQDPFLFCAYHNDAYPEGNGKMGIKSNELQGRHLGQDFAPHNSWRMYHGRQVPGFPYHPHRGFETITINKQGVVDHSDSLGAAGRFMAGDVQWMTAGKGIQHSEMFPLLNDNKPNHLEIFQVWLNLPKVSKFVPPHFKMLWKEEIPKVTQKQADGKTAEADLIAGELDGKKALEPTPNSWAADVKNKIRVLTVKIEAGANWKLSATSKTANRNIYFYEGDTLKIGTVSIEKEHRVALNPTLDITIENNGQVAAFLLVLEGNPIGEPVAQHGPFVMNTMDEIREAIADYQRTEFGGWPWKERETVHGAEKGRFAKHADGKEEVK